MSAIGFHKLLVLFVMILLTAILIVARSIFRDDIQTSFTRYIISTLMLASLVAMFMLFRNRGNYGTTASGRTIPSSHHGGYLYSDRIDNFLERYTPTISIYVFGAGSLFLCLLYMIASVQCFPYYWWYRDDSDLTNSTVNTTTSKVNFNLGIRPEPQHRLGMATESLAAEELSRLILHITSILFFAFQLPFLQLFSSFHRLRHNYVLHHTLLIIIAADIAHWLYTFLKESNLMPEYNNAHDLHPVWTSLPKACLEHATVLDVFKHNTLDHSVFPLTLEFTLASGEILIEAWFLTCSPGSPTPTASPTMRRKRRVRSQQSTAAVQHIQTDSGSESNSEMNGHVLLRQNPSEPIPGPSETVKVVLKPDNKVTSDSSKAVDEDDPVHQDLSSVTNLNSIGDGSSEAVDHRLEEDPAMKDPNLQLGTEPSPRGNGKGKQRLQPSSQNNRSEQGVEPYPGQTVQSNTAPVELIACTKLDLGSDTDSFVDVLSSDFNSDMTDDGAVPFVNIVDSTVESSTPRIRRVANQGCSRAWVTFIRAFNIYTALLSALVEISFVQFFLLHNEIPEERETYMDSHEFELHIKIPTSLVRIMLINIPGLIVVCHCWNVMRTFKEIRPSGSGVGGSDVILILSACGVMGLSFCEVIICLSNITKSWIFFLNVLEPALYMPQIILTAFVIRLGLTRQGNVSHRYFPTLQMALSYLAMYSFGRWVVDSFLETEYVTETDRYPGAWEVCVHLFLPLCIYFRFISILLLLKVKRLLRQSKEEFRRCHPRTACRRRLLPPQRDRRVSSGTSRSSRHTRTNNTNDRIKYVKL